MSVSGPINQRQIVDIAYAARDIRPYIPARWRPNCGAPTRAKQRDCWDERRRKKDLIYARNGLQSDDEWHFALEFINTFTLETHFNLLTAKAVDNGSVELSAINDGLASARYSRTRDSECRSGSSIDFRQHSSHGHLTSCGCGSVAPRSSRSLMIS